MDVKKYLEKHKELDYSLEFYRNKMKGISSPLISGEAKSTVKKSKYISEMDKMNEIRNEMHEIQQFIEDNFEGLERNVIWERYIKYKTIFEIASDIDMSRSFTSHMISKAIKNCDAYINKR